MYQYRVSFSDAVQRAISQYCDFSGRASRSEYWWWALFTFVILGALGVCQGIFLGLSGPGSTLGKLFDWLQWIFDIAVFLPSLGLCVRRLHDIGKSGWNVLWGLLPIAGAIILLVYYLRDSQMHDNEYGPVPNLAPHPNR